MRQPCPPSLFFPHISFPSPPVCLHPGEPISLTFMQFGGCQPTSWCAATGRKPLLRTTGEDWIFSTMLSVRTEEKIHLLPHLLDFPQVPEMCHSGSDFPKWRLSQASDRGMKLLHSEKHISAWLRCQLAPQLSA